MLSSVRVNDVMHNATTGLRYDLTDTAGMLENKVLGMFHGFCANQT